MYRRPRRDEWYGPSYGHHYPTAHWPISALSVPPCPSLPLCLVHRPFSHSLSRILFPLCLARHVSRFDSGTFRCCVVTRVMHRNFKGPRHREISPPEYIRREGTMPRTKAICFLFPDRSLGPWWFVIAYEYIPTRFEGYWHRRRRVVYIRSCVLWIVPCLWMLKAVSILLDLEYGYSVYSGPNETTARFARKFAKFKREPSWISMPNVGGKRSLESTRAAYEPGLL